MMHSLLCRRYTYLITAVYDGPQPAKGWEEGDMNQERKQASQKIGIWCIIKNNNFEIDAETSRVMSF